ncbi:MAG: helix-turn-helix domain-containing protein [Geminicoccaceae bacterium]
MTPADRIIEAVAENLMVSVSAIKSQDKSRKVTKARHIAMAVIRRRCSLSCGQISRKFFGKDDHSTVKYACNKVASDPELSELADDIESGLTA